MPSMHERTVTFKVTVKPMVYLHFDPSKQVYLSVETELSYTDYSKKKKIKKKTTHFCLQRFDCAKIPFEAVRPKIEMRNILLHDTLN